jgi:hypothetical protein
MLVPNPNMEGLMRKRQLARTFTAGAAFAGLLLIGMSVIPSPGRADNEGNGTDNEEQLAQIGLNVASSSGIVLNMNHKDRKLVGLGSFLVNVAGDCNGCHTKDPTTEYVNPTGNPYLLHPPFTGVKKVNPATYLGGGSYFATLPTGNPAPTGTVDIYSRNLTPDISGLPEGGHSLSDFIQIMRTGVDFDHLHTNLTAPLNGNVLQVMPWPNFQNMTDHQLKAIWTFLSAIPCIDTVVAGQPQLRNTCQ